MPFFIIIALTFTLSACSGGSNSENVDSGAESSNGSGTDSQATDYPSGNINFLVGAGPGGGTDNFARSLVEQFEEMYDTNVNVTNLEQASGAVANERTANEEPDGHTLNFASSTYIITVAAGQNNTGLDELTPVARMQSDILSITVDPEQFEDFDEFKEFAENNPGELTVGGTHAASPDEMGLLELNEASGLDLDYVPYDGSGEAQADLLGGNIDALLEYPSAMLDYVESGDMQPILFLAEERLDEFSDVPTTTEYGWDVTNGNERGVLVDADTPDEIIKELEEALHTIYESDEYKEYEESNHLHYREGWMGAEEYRQKLEENKEMYEEFLNNK